MIGGQVADLEAERNAVDGAGLNTFIGRRRPR